MICPLNKQVESQSSLFHTLQITTDDGYPFIRQGNPGRSVGTDDFLAVAVETEPSLCELGALQQRPEVMDAVLLHPLLKGPVDGNSGLKTDRRA